MADVADLIRVGNVSGLGRTRYRALVERFGSWSAAVRASTADIASVPGISRKLAGAIRRSPETDAAEEMEEAAAMGVDLIPYSAPGFPANLAIADDAPLLLYVKGRIIEQDRMALAIVGSRSCSFYGRSQAEKLAYRLASAGFTIVSGLARGIDASAHRAALDAGGRTIAVIGAGLKRIYPEEHGELAERIAESGAVVSELPLDAPPRAQNFPVRNRIIAALSMGVVIVEARTRSGALITARWAMENGKEVFAVPGQVDNPRAQGCHALIKDGAKLVERAEDIVEELGPLADSVDLTASEAKGAAEPRAPGDLPETERAILAAADHTPQTVDVISGRAEVGTPDALTGLLRLEMRGLIKQLPGKRFVRVGAK